MPYKLVARLPEPGSGTFEADCPNLENAVQKARGLLEQNKAFVLQVTDPDGKPVDIKGELNANRP